jgi:hypothetical protein
VTARTWIVSATDKPVRTDEVDHLARSAEGGLSYRTGEELPPYLGVWADPQNGHPWHLYSDYPATHHERFGWAQRENEGGADHA